MDMGTTPKHVRLRPAVESVENLTKLKTAKTPQLNAVNVRDPTKHGTTNAQLMKRKILREIRHQLPYKFIVPKHAFQERESEEEEEEESPPNFDDNTNHPRKRLAIWHHRADLPNLLLPNHDLPNLDIPLFLLQA